MENMMKIAKVHNPKGSKHEETRVFASGLPFPQVKLSCQCRKPSCDHTVLVSAFLACGIQVIGSRFKIYPATAKYMGPQADKKNVFVILDEIKARKAGNEPTVKAKTFPPKSTATVAIPVTTAAAPVAPVAPVAPQEILCGWLDMTPEEMSATKEAHLAVKAAALAKAAAFIAEESAKAAAHKAAAPTIETDKAAALAKAGLLALDLD